MKNLNLYRLQNLLKPILVFSFLTIAFFIKIPLLVDLSFVLAGFLVIIFFFPKKARKILLLSFTIRILFIIIDQCIYPLPKSGPGSDAYMFESRGWLWSQNGITWLMKNFTSGAHMYSWFIALVYSIFGRNSFLIQFLNSLFGTFIVYNIYLIAKNIWSEKEGNISAWICAFFPTLIYFSVLPFREVPIVFLFTLGLFFFLKWVKESKIPYVFISQCFFALSMGLHTGMIWVITFPIFEVSYEIALALKTKNRSILVKKTFAFLIVLFIFLIVFSTGFGFEKMPNNTSNVISSLEEEQENAARDRAAYLVGLSIQKNIDIIWQVPLRIIYFLFAPFIWMVKIPIDLLGFFDAIFYIALSLLIIFSLKIIVKSKYVLILLVFLLGEIIIFALTTSNYGTALRHRAKFVYIMIALSSFQINRILLFVNTRFYKGRINGKST